MRIINNDCGSFVKCDTCPYLKNTEFEQSESKICLDHICTKFNKVLRHFSLAEHEALWYKDNPRLKKLYLQKFGRSKHIKACNECFNQLKKDGYVKS